MNISDEGAMRLMAAILRQAYDDYAITDHCPEGYSLIETCEARIVNKKHCDAKRFIHSTWCASMCEGLNIDYVKYLHAAMDKCVLTKNVFKFIEGELRAYRQTCKAIDELKNAIIESAPVKQEGRSSVPGNPTLAKVTKILMNNKLQRQQKIVDAINKVYNRSDSRKKELIEQLYWNGRYTESGIAYKLGIARKTVYNWKKNIVYEIAIELDLL